MTLHTRKTGAPITQAEYAHLRLDAIEPKLDKLLRNSWVQTGVIAAVIFLMNYPHIFNSLKPISSAEASSAEAKASKK